MSYEISDDAVRAWLVGLGYAESGSAFALQCLADRGRYQDAAVSIYRRGPDRNVAVSKGRL